MISDNARAGMQQAPARSLFNALGFTPEEMKKPMVGIVSSFNEIVPGHMNIDKIVEAVKLGVAEAGGVPVVFPAIAVCDGIAMGHVGMKYSLKSGIVNKVYAYIAPKLFGGADAKTPIEGMGTDSPAHAVMLGNSKVTKLGDDFLIECDVV